MRDDACRPCWTIKKEQSPVPRGAGPDVVCCEKRFRDKKDPPDVGGGWLAGMCCESRPQCYARSLSATGRKNA